MLVAPHAVLALLVVVIATIAAVTDLRTGLIPNRLLAAGLGLLLAIQVILVTSGNGLRSVPGALLGSLLGAVACGLIPVAIYFARGLGGGDLKLLTLCGVGLGPVVGLEAQLYAFALGSLFVVGRATYQGTLWATLRGSTTVLANRLVPARLRHEVAPAALTPVRFAPWILAGVATAVVDHWRTP
jgi:prepilin peptidase CpaA